MGESGPRQSFQQRVRLSFGLLRMYWASMDQILQRGKHRVNQEKADAIEPCDL